MSAKKINVQNNQGIVNIDSLIYDQTIRDVPFGEEQFLDSATKIIDRILREIPHSLSEKEQSSVSSTLAYIRKNLDKNHEKKWFIPIAEKLKPFIYGTVATTAFASSITDLITFFSK